MEGIEEVFAQVGLNMEHVMMAIQLADDDSNGTISHTEFLNALHTLHDNTQKYDVWLVKLKVGEVGRSVASVDDRLRQVESNVARVQDDVTSQKAILCSIARHLGLEVQIESSPAHVEVAKQEGGAPASKEHDRLVTSNTNSPLSSSLITEDTSGAAGKSPKPRSLPPLSNSNALDSNRSGTQTVTTGDGFRLMEDMGLGLVG